MTSTLLIENANIAVGESTFLKNQLGVISKQDFKKGHVLFFVRGPIIFQPTKYSFSVDLNKHIDPLRSDGSFDFGHYLNHSCDPNTVIHIVNNEELPFIEMVARRNVKLGEELTFDYASLEYDTVAKTTCDCRTNICRGVIHGFRDLPDHISEKYQQEEMIPDHLLNLKKR